VANITMTTGWNFSTGPDEAALILAALGGRLKPEDRAAAKHLGDTLTLLRARQARLLAQQMEQHAAKVQS